MVAVEIDFVCADDADHSFRSWRIGIAHGGSKEHPRRPQPRSRSFWIYYFRSFDSLRQEPNSPINLSQSSLAILIVSIFITIAIACGPPHYFHHSWAILRKQKLALIFQALEPAWSDVILAVVRRGFLSFGSSCETLSHATAPSWSVAGWPATGTVKQRGATTIPIPG